MWIRGITNKNYVISLRKDRGFTLIECLIALFCLLIIATLFLQTATTFRLLNKPSQSFQYQEWEVFLNQLKKEVRNAKSVTIQNNKLNLTSESSLILIENYQNKIRRRVNGQGHEVMLQNIINAHFEIMDSIIYIKVQHENGFEEGIIRFYVQ
ncbi:competence type IV pilus minor pilin ComGF [Peribacillus alkalitolerans]|uniref:competence type IV pilus minor pilin ComGF n=1 Tax=Peribacillus alkalitolerans TaxID=1550385 RepID=UPI0019676387|nr:competence type IV pilus minor pilin ComGF [Peribacillus alkalitolerans]